MPFGERIKLLRIENNWTQKYVCKKLNISSGALSRYESGLYEPKSLELVKDFANLFEVSTDYLLGQSNERNIQIEQNSNNPQLTLQNYYNKLNENGKKKAIEYMQDLIDTPKYTSKQ